MNQGSRLSLHAPAHFDLASAVTSYGFYVLAPNHWDATNQTFSRPITLDQGKVVHIHVRTHPNNKRQLLIQCDSKLKPTEQKEIKHAIGRILRLEEDFTPWWQRHPGARKRKFARLLRSPTVFEDIIRTMTSCNVAWPNTKNMNARLCNQVGKGSFPTPAQLARWEVEDLKAACKVGYRAQWIVKLAREIESGQRNVESLDDPAIPDEQLESQLRDIQGIGPYACNNMFMLLGRYQRLAIDTETVAHFVRHHHAHKPTTHAQQKKLEQRVREHYAHFTPYQFLAYWYELWTGDLAEKVAGEI